MLKWPRDWRGRGGPGDDGSMKNIYGSIYDFSVIAYFYMMQFISRFPVSDFKLFMFEPSTSQ